MKPALFAALAAGTTLFVYGLRILCPALILTGAILAAVCLSLAFAASDFGGEER